MNSRLKHIDSWEELAEQASWSVMRFARVCAVSVRTLERYFLEHKGKCPKVWLNEKRQRKAVQLLHKGYSVKETANRLGYRWESTFSREFKKHWGFSPAHAQSECVSRSVVA